MRAKLLLHSEITEQTPVDTVRGLMERPVPGYDWRRWSPQFAGWDNVKEAHRMAFRQAISASRAQSFPAPPHGGEGRGVVIVGGGRYFASAYVTIRVLRHIGSNLPIELWYLGRKSELTPQQAAIVGPLGVKCVDADLVAERLGGARMLNGWELKPFATLRCGFREVLALDADSYPVRDPEFLFAEPDYVESGAIFWPDQATFDLKRSVWETVGLPYRDEPCFESGQYVIDKARHWQTLWLAHWLNEHSDFYYRHFWGDKETFHLALAALEAPYGMPRKRWAGSLGTMVQHDMYGRPLFNHRTHDKFSLEHDKGGFTVFATTAQSSGKQLYNPALELEQEAHGFLDELAEKLGLPPQETLAISIDTPTYGSGAGGDGEGGERALQILRYRHPWPDSRPAIATSETSRWFSGAHIAGLDRLFPVTGTFANTVLEVGSWTGKSTAWFVHRGATVIALDHWLGSVQDREVGTPGLETLYEQFLANRWNDRGRIIPLRTEAAAGMRSLGQAGVSPDVVYLDASYDPADVVANATSAARLFPRAKIVGAGKGREDVDTALTRLKSLGHECGADGPIWWLK